MLHRIKIIGIGLLIMMAMANAEAQGKLELEVYETSAEGNRLTKIPPTPSPGEPIHLALRPQQRFQVITGFGGAFTESSAYLLNQLSKEQRERVIDAYFSPSGAHYSLTRTHMNSCDFSLSQYSYAPIEGDVALELFTVKEDEEDLIPMIKAAMAASQDGFKIIASPWTAPPWMKDNKNWVGGKLLPEYQGTWALFFSKYIQAYKEKSIPIWGITVENEPHGNGNNWESMHFTPKEMTDFVVDHLGPRLEKDGFAHVKILGYDQNRKGIPEWVDEMYRDSLSTKYYAGTAVHWYESTFDYFPDMLQYAHDKAPNKYLIETEGCIDAEIPKWEDDAWYWSKEATDWGWDWAPEEEKHLHPKYVPVYRYARDIIGCLNNWVDGWIDWNMVLDKQGGPNWFKNWCGAPVLVDTATDAVYFTPLYHTMAHFSKFIRPGAHRIGLECNQLADDRLMATAAENPDGSLALILFNPEKQSKSINVALGERATSIKIAAQAIQTIIIKPHVNN